MKVAPRASLALECGYLHIYIAFLFEKLDSSLHTHFSSSLCTRTTLSTTMSTLTATATDPTSDSFTITALSYEPPEKLPSSAKFEPAKHLAYRARPKQHSMESLGFKEQGISDVAVTDPFPLFSKDGIVEFRRDILSTKVQQRYRVTSHMAKSQAREYNSLVSCLFNLLSNLFGEENGIA